MVSYSKTHTPAAQRIARTAGRITQFDVDLVLDDPGNRYRASLVYRYTVNGQDYFSTQICPVNADGQQPALNRRQIEFLVRIFSEQRPITVYYNTANPADAYLIEPPKRGLLLSLLGALLNR